MLSFYQKKKIATWNSYSSSNLKPWSYDFLLNFLTNMNLVIIDSYRSVLIMFVPIFFLFLVLFSFLKLSNVFRGKIVHMLSKFFIYLWILIWNWIELQMIWNLSLSWLSWSPLHAGIIYFATLASVRAPNCQCGQHRSFSNSSALWILLWPIG